MGRDSAANGETTVVTVSVAKSNKVETYDCESDATITNKAVCAHLLRSLKTYGSILTFE